MADFELHYEMIQTRRLKFEVATHGAGDRLALLLHGFPECAYSYRFQIPLLTRLGYRVWAPNLRGYGRTDRPRGRVLRTASLLGVRGTIQAADGVVHLVAEELYVPTLSLGSYVHPSRDFH